MNAYLEKIEALKTKERYEAANMALWLAVISLNESMGVGAKRLRQFAEKLAINTDEFERMKKADGFTIAKERVSKRVEEIMDMKGAER